MLKKTFSFFIFHFSFLILFAVSSHAVSVYPNPWIPDSNKTDSLGRKIHGTYYGEVSGGVSGGIHFTGLPESGGTIYIYNSTGEIVRKLRWSSGNTKIWDGRNERHEFVASGVYMWVIKEVGTKTGKIVIIR